jgi:hypothetical protein
MAEKRYKITAAVLASARFAQTANYTFATSFQQAAGAGETRICQAKDCPAITCVGADVLGTENVWAQKFMEAAMIPPVAIKVDGSSWLGTPGAAVFEITTDPVTIDLDSIFPV